MDQSKDILELSENFKIDLDQVPFLGKSNEKKKVARRRWAILAKALKSPSGSQPSSPTDEISVRRISSFMLLNTHELSGPPADDITDQISKRTWFDYSIAIDQEVFSLNIGHRNRTFSAEDLMGFNNTGNICIWPSEETLSYYVCSNLSIFDGKNVLELGGGMSCLAGLFVAKYAAPKNVLVTDGNKTSMENVQAILQCNTFTCPTECAVLKWGDQKETYTQYDAIISADCLFFDDARHDFVDCICNYLSPEGQALVMAPQRGTTLDSFILQSESRGLVCKKVMNYSDVVWEKRLALMDHAFPEPQTTHNANTSPLDRRNLSGMRRKSPTYANERADYWKSQDKKYCDFCKCWIADNKPSRDFHENGRRHKENVKKRLKTISKDSAKSYRESEKVDATIKAMEAAAMEAYRKDVENNADWTSIAINKKMEEENLEIAGSSSNKVWREVASKDGQHYYWNAVTKESSWEVPPEGYLSIDEQREEKDKETVKQLKEVEKYEQKEALLRVEEEKQQDKEERARLAREKLKERRVKEETPPPVYGPILDPGKNDPYGKWETIQQSAPVDLQLPEQEHYECPVVAEPEPVVKEFKEKTVQSLGDSEGGSSFKKRKILSGAKRNTRKRLDDD